MPMIKTVFIFTLIWVLNSSVWSLETDKQFGEASFKFLKLPLAPRIAGMAGSGVAAILDASGLDLNPAGAAAEGGLIVVGRGYPFAEFQSNSNFITWSLPIQSYRLLLNARYLGFNNIPGFLENNQSTTDYGAHTLKLQVGAAGVLKDVQWGLTGNFAQNNIAEANYATVMINGGLHYEVWKGLSIGASGTNADIWTSKAQYTGNANPFPPTALQAGLAYKQSLTSNLKVTGAVDARSRNDEELTWPIGLEMNWRDCLYGRAGFPMGEQEPGIALGLGLRWDVFQFDYAFQSHETLSPAHYWSLGIKL